MHVRAYLLSGLLAVVAGFFLASEVGFGHPTVGSSYTLTSIAAAVLGGASLAGGRGSFVGAMFGALFFTLTVNIITLLGLSTAVGIIVSGALTLFAVFLYSGWQPVKRGLAHASRALHAASKANAAGMSAPVGSRRSKPGHGAAPSSMPRVQMRFVAIWLALIALHRRRRDRRAAQPAALSLSRDRTARRLPR